MPQAQMRSTPVQGEFFDTLPFARPRCGECGVPMWLVAITKPAPRIYKFQCKACDGEASVKAP
jgi:hypothetical protein